MKQSFEVFEQSDGIALHLTVTVDSDPFIPAARHAISGLKNALSVTGKRARESCRDSLNKLAVVIANDVRQETSNAVYQDDLSKEERGRDSRQSEIDLLYAKIAELQEDLADAKKAAKKPRTPRKAARK